MEGGTSELALPAFQGLSDHTWLVAPSGATRVERTFPFRLLIQSDKSPPTSKFGPIDVPPASWKGAHFHLRSKSKTKGNEVDGNSVSAPRPHGNCDLVRDWSKS